MHARLIVTIDMPNNSLPHTDTALAAASVLISIAAAIIYRLAVLSSSSSSVIFKCCLQQLLSALVTAKRTLIGCSNTKTSSKLDKVELFKMNERDFRLSYQRQRFKTRSWSRNFAVAVFFLLFHFFCTRFLKKQFKNKPLKTYFSYFFSLCFQ